MTTPGSALDGGKPILVIAPHLVFPERNGADISLERIARFLSNHAQVVDLIASDRIRSYKRGEVLSEVPIENKLRSKGWATIRCLLFQTHYLLERFNTEAIREAISSQWSRRDYGTVLMSYMVTLPMLPRPTDRRLLLWTHNDEKKWFSDLRKFSRNPLRGIVIDQTLRWLDEEVEGLSAGVTFIHVSENDRAAFQRWLPRNQHLVTSVGTDLGAMALGGGKADSAIILTFIGSLGVKMAEEALIHFRERFEPELRRSFAAKLQVRIVGSNPTAAIRRLCNLAAWELHADLSDEMLAIRLEESLFTILPFPYATGIKLKLVRSLGGGVPFLATNVTKPANMVFPKGCCFSDEAADWVATIREWLSAGDIAKRRAELVAIATSYSWPNVTAELAGAISRLPPSPSEIYAKNG